MFRRGLSELLGLLIIILVIGIGALLFSYSSNLFRNRSRIQETSIDVSIQYGDGYSILNVKATNIGTSEISKILVYSEYITKGGEPLNHTYTEIIKSGSSIELSISIDQGFSKIPVPVKVTVFFVDGEGIEKQFYIYPEYTG